MITAVVLVLLGIVVAVLTVLVVSLLRSHAEILRALHDLGVNLDPERTEDGLDAADSPLRSQRVAGTDWRADISGITPSGDAVHVAVANVEQRTLLAFLSSSCASCHRIWLALADEDALASIGARVIAVTRGFESESPAAIFALAPPNIVTVASSEAWSSYGVRGAPYFVLVDGPSATIVGEGTAPTWDQVMVLLARAVGDEDRLRADAALSQAGIGPGHPSLSGRNGPPAASTQAEDV